MFDELPEELYRKCGFSGNDVWHILRKRIKDEGQDTKEKYMDIPMTNGICGEEYER